MTLMNHIVYLSSDEEDEKPKNIAHRKSDLSDPTVEDDDDCVVLDGDPYKETTVDTCEIDDVLVLGQKGEIACRDYPHSRHACAKYPYNSTPHQNYCEMCHCYVCDTCAPCAFWFKGFANIDHCHANDKDHLWRNQRECIRTGKLPPLPIAQLHRPQNSNSPGIRACSASMTVAAHTNTHATHGYRAEQPRTFPQNPVLQPSGGQLYQNPSPQVVSSNPFAWTKTPGGGVIQPENSVHNIAQDSTGDAPPAASQGNPHRIIPGYSSTVPYAGQYRPIMCSGNVQTSAAIPSQTPNPWVNQQQQQHSGKSNDKLLSALEDWLMDPSTLSGQYNTTTPSFDYGTFLE